MKKNILTSSVPHIIGGLIMGAIAALLAILGNPANMGLCIACFTRDIAGALGLHSAAVVQYLRPEVMGIVLGAFIAAVVSKEFSPRAGSNTFLRFTLGVFAMIGSLVFLGCPWRTILRLAGGDVNAVFGLLGIIAGSGIGVLFWNKGYDLGSSTKQPKLSGLIPAIGAVVLVLLAIFPIKFSENGPVFASTSGPGSLHAPALISLGLSAVVGFIAQRSRFCTIGGIRDGIYFREFHNTIAVAVFFLTALVINIFSGRFNLSMVNQPVAHTDFLWNFLSMVLAALCFTLAFGCPGRQLVLMAEGDLDSGIFILGMLLGAAFSHNFNLASSAAGPTLYGKIAVIIGRAIACFIGFARSKKNERS